MAEKLIISTLEPVEVGDTFPSLPLHVTLMPWFKIEGTNNLRGLNRYLALIASKRSQLELTGKNLDKFGPKRDVDVRVLEDTKKLRKLHGDLVAVVGWSEGTCESPYIRGNYAPHVSFVNGVSLDEGELVKADALQLIDRDLVTHERTVEKVFPLGIPFDPNAKY